MTMIDVQPLTKQAFAPFGEVIECDGAEHFPINKGFTQRFHKLASVVLGQEGDEAIINLFRSQRWPHPVALTMLEQHPQGSQAFIPMDACPFLVVVADKDEQGQPNRLHAFVTNGNQGVNYGLGVWHHPLLILAPEQDFIVVDRSGAGNNLIEVDLDAAKQASLDMQALVAQYLEAQ